MEIMKFNSGNEIISVQIHKKNIKNVHLKVFRDLTVKLSVPTQATDLWVKRYLESKLFWIDKQLYKYKKSLGNNNIFSLQNGSSTQFLGKDLRIIIEEGNNEVRREEKKVVFAIKDPTRKEIFDKKFSDWWRKQAIDIYNKIVDELMPIFSKHKVVRPDICIRKMKTLWGSCTKSKNKITLNEYLLKADISCIEYVILHELTHLIYHNHNKEFYDFITIYMPDWQERKKKLDLEVVQGL